MPLRARGAGSRGYAREGGREKGTDLLKARFLGLSTPTLFSLASATQGDTAWVLTPSLGQHHIQG